MRIKTRKLVDHFMGGRRTTYETGIEFDDSEGIGLSPLILTSGGSTKEESEANFRKMIMSTRSISDVESTSSQQTTERSCAAGIRTGTTSFDSKTASSMNVDPSTPVTTGMT